MFRYLITITLIAGLLTSCGFRRKKYENPITKDTKQPDKVLFDRSIDDDFSIDVPFDNIETVTLETDQFFAPADRSRPWRRSGDRRHLGLRIFRCEIRPAS